MDVQGLVYTILWLTYIVGVVIGSEIFGYFWHRYGAHADYIPGIHDTHRIHHMTSLDSGHEADEDFIWILLMLSLIHI